MPMMARIRAGLMAFTTKGEIDRFLDGLLERYPHGEVPEVGGLAALADGEAAVQESPEAPGCGCGS
jgi:hypothetical protein